MPRNLQAVKAWGERCVFRSKACTPTLPSPTQYLACARSCLLQAIATNCRTVQLSFTGMPPDLQLLID